MEHLLNLAWILGTVLLFAAMFRERARGRLRCSLPAALACTALIALALFPVVSMTDDVLRSKLYGDPSAPHAETTLMLRSLEDVSQHDALLLPGMLLLLMLASSLGGAERLRRSSQFLPGPQLRGLRPLGVRPPPVAAFLPAVS